MVVLYVVELLDRTGRQKIVFLIKFITRATQECNLVMDADDRDFTRIYYCTFLICEIIQILKIQQSNLLYCTPPPPSQINTSQMEMEIPSSLQGENNFFE